MNSIANMNDTTAAGMWPFGCEVVANDLNEWMQTQQQMPNPSMHSTVDNPMTNINQNRFNSVEEVSHFDSNAYPMSGASHAAHPLNAVNALNYSTSNLPLIGANGVPPHLSSQLFQSVSGGPDSDYWNPKMVPMSAPNASLGNGMSGNQSTTSEQKINWNNWNHNT